MTGSDIRSAQDLQWPELCSAISAYAVSEQGRLCALELKPAEDAETAQTRQAVMAEVMLLAESGFLLPAGEFKSVTESLLRVERGGLISGSEFAEVRRCLRVAQELDRFGGEHQEQAPLLGRMFVVDPDLVALRRELDLTLDDQGDVLDEASVELAQARREVRKVRDEIKSKMTELITRYREALQDGYFAERDGRYVLPVRTDAPYRVDGVVLGTSGSGSTLYVEPQELGRLGNRLRLAEGEVERIVAIILGRLCESLLPMCSEVRWAEEICTRADLLHACAAFSQRIGARVVAFDEPGKLSALAARHPLLCLQLETVVPSDLAIGPEQALVLSGPNAGGKTVALKTLGLLALMQSTGLPVPAAVESKIGYFDEVLCDIGDDQSLSMSLSTFSGHVQRVVGIIEDAGHGSLVLFDELMGGTDPDEGAVLAIATIEALVKVGASVCVTTHYEALKEQAAESSLMENGAVGFDFDRMEPTYVVTMGRPGASSALIVAGKYGLPSRIVERAEGLLPETVARERETRLAVEQFAVKIQNERNELARLQREHDELVRRLDAQLEREKKKQQQELTREGDALRTELKAARAEVRRIQASLKSAGKGELNRLQSDLDRAARVDAVGGELHRKVRAPKPSAASVDASRISVGAQVTVAGFSIQGEVLELPKKGMVRVMLGVMRMNVALADIVAVKASSVQASIQNAGPKKRKSNKLTLDAETPESLVKSAEITLDLRGQRVEDGLLAVDRFVDELIQHHELGGFVLHGHGTGAMKEAVRQHLRGHHLVSRSRPCDRDEGGDAHTIFWLTR